MGQPRRIQATQVGDLEEIAASRHVVTVTAGPHHDLVVLSLDAPPDYRTTASGGASFAKLRADRPNHYRIDHFLGGEWHSLALPPTRENFHCVQPLEENRWLLVRGRAKGETDRNAHVHAPDGTHCDSFHAGDGIENVQATEKSRIWVSFFDEGVFGDNTLGAFAAYREVSALAVNADSATLAAYNAAAAAYSAAHHPDFVSTPSQPFPDAVLATARAVAAAGSSFGAVDPTDPDIENIMDSRTAPGSPWSRTMAEEQLHLCGLIRDIIGNPFRTLTTHTSRTTQLKLKKTRSPSRMCEP